MSWHFDHTGPQVRKGWRQHNSNEGLKHTHKLQLHQCLQTLRTGLNITEHLTLHQVLTL